MTIISRDEVIERLHLPASLLVRYERRGLIRTVREGDIEGFEPSEMRRVWAVASLHRDLGINLAGVEAILRLRQQMDDVHAQLAELAQHLNKALELETHDGGA